MASILSREASVIWVELRRSNPPKVANVEAVLRTMSAWVAKRRWGATPSNHRVRKSVGAPKYDDPEV